MRVIAEKVLASQLKPGELYSFNDQEQWDHMSNRSIPSLPVIGYMVQVRSNDPCPDIMVNIPVYRLSVLNDEDDR